MSADDGMARLARLRRRESDPRLVGVPLSLALPSAGETLCGPVPPPCPLDDDPRLDMGVDPTGPRSPPIDCANRTDVGTRCSLIPSAGAVRLRLERG